MAAVLSSRDRSTLLRAWADRRGLGRVLQPAWRQIAAAVGPVEGAFLQVSCGPAWLGLIVGSGHPELDVVGIDPDAAALAVGEQHLGTRLNITLRRMDPSHIVYPDRTFHVAAAVGALRRWPDPGAVLTEVHRVLRPGGVFYIYEIDAALASLPEGWIDLPGVPFALLGPALRARGTKAEAWEELKVLVRQSPFGGGEDGRHGPFLRLALTRRPV